MPLVLGGQSATAAAFSVDNSCRFNRADSALLSITPAGDGNKRTFTLSIWVKRSDIGSIGTASVNMMMDAVGSGGLSFYETDAIKFYIDNVYGQATTVLYKDPSAWMHIVQAVDTTDAVAGDRIKTYVNGVRVTSFSSENNPPINTDSKFNNSSVVMSISQASASFGGYIAEAIMIDGLQLEPTSFGQFNEDSPTVWEPIDPSGLTFGTNGFYLDFKDSADLGNDVSGNDNDMTSTNLDATNQMTDTPTNNFATLNPLYKTILTYREGNTLCDNPTTTWNAAIATMAAANGKWYIECKNVAASSEPATRGDIGITDSGGAMAASTNEPSYTTNSVAITWASGVVRKDGSTEYTGTSIAVGDILGIAMDLDNGFLYFADENVWMNSGDPESGATGTGGVILTTGLFYMFAGSTWYNAEYSLNAGNPNYANTSDAADENGYGRFEFAPPSGYYAMCTKNLGEFG
jgi:hypothetical protein